MEDRHHRPALPGLPLPSQLRHPALDAEDGLHGRRTGQHDYGRVDQGQLLIQPRATRPQFPFFGRRLLGGRHLMALQM